jgi:hypothetical protein
VIIVVDPALPRSVLNYSALSICLAATHNYPVGKLGGP